MTDFQKTLQSEVSITGIGLHTGEQVTLTIKPAPENYGYKFIRTDIESKPVITAHVDNVVETQRGTTLEQNNARVYTTEHILAALYGLEIDNAIIEIDGQEVPILDGSAKPFVDALLSVGIKEQKAPKEYFVLQENITYEAPEKGVEMLAVPSEDFRITVMVDYNSPLLGTQHASMYHIGEFKEEIAPCRTFVFLREIESLYNQGLIKGGDVDNAIVMIDKEVADEELWHLASLFGKTKDQISQYQVKGVGFLNNVKLHFENEPARHKLLDIVGDLALIGKPIKGHILAARPGHASNVAFAKILNNLIKKTKKQSPEFDLNKESIYTIQDIERMLPHRYPFLLVDRIIEIGEQHIVGVKNVTANEHFFQGHFPKNPVMPGVLIVEAMAQTGGILVLSQVPDPENYETYFMKIDNVKFKQKVIPGDTLVFKLEMTAPIRRGICQMKASAYVRNRLVAEGEMMAQVAKKKVMEHESAS